MVQPVNFLQNFDRSPLQTVAANVNALQGNVQNANVLQQQALTNQLQQQQIQSAQAQQDLAQQFQTDFQGALESGDILGLTTKYPQFSERIKQVNDFRQGLIDSGAGRVASQIVNAIDRKDSRGVFNLLEENKDVINSFGDPNFSFENARQMMIEDPEQFRALAKSTADLAGVQTGSISDFNQAKLALEEKKIEASKEPKPITSFQQQSLELRRAQQELDKLKLDAQKETDALTRERLNVDIQKKTQEVADKKEAAKKRKTDLISSANTIIANSNDTLALMDKMIANKVGMQNAIGASSVVPIVPGTAQADFIADLETLRSRNFLVGIKDFKESGGSGALSDQEGKQLNKVVQSLDRGVREKTFISNLGNIRKKLDRQIKAAQKTLRDNPLEPEEQTTTTQAQVFTSPSGIQFTVE
jgi:hypothetical protein